MTEYNIALVSAATLNGLAACLHVACIFGGPSWYRRFGAPERVVSAAEAGHWYPAIITVSIAAVLAVWSGYALAGAGFAPDFPFTKVTLIFITGIYLLRRLAAIPVIVLIPKLANPFVVWSSILCTALGAIHLLGLIQAWSMLGF